jgi:hypothetical protein
MDGEMIKVHDSRSDTRMTRSGQLRSIYLLATSLRNVILLASQVINRKHRLSILFSLFLLSDTIFNCFSGLKLSVMVSDILGFMLGAVYPV